MDNLPEQPNLQDPKPGFPAQSTPPPPVPEVAIQPTQPKKKSIIKIFAVLAIFLFLVLASELAYYFFTVKRREAGQEPLTAQIPEQLQPGKPTPTPTPTPTEEDIFGGAINFEKVDGIFDPLIGYTKPVYQKGEVKLVSGGKVTEVTFDKQGEEGLSISLQTITAPTTEFGIRFTKEEVETLTILAIKDSQPPQPWLWPK